MTLLFSAYCGLESPRLTEDQCRDGLLALAARHLPNGHTVIEAQGRWLSPTRGVVNEPTIVIQVFAERGDAVHQALLTVADLYKAQADQDAVLIIGTEAQIDFV